MSHTNSTTNYNLPQFIGTDKPTWLGDVNGAMSAIDAQMKANADNATTSGTNATTALNNIGTLSDLETSAKNNVVSAVNELNTAVGVAQNTATTTATNLYNFEQQFNLSIIKNGNLDNTTTTGGVHNLLKLAQNTLGTIFKLYGTFQMNPNSSATVSPIAGMSGYYGIDVNLTLNAAPDTAYIVNGAGIRAINSSTWDTTGCFAVDFAVGTNGHIYILPSTSSNIISQATGTLRNNYLPCLYFNASFGDEPTPDN